MVHIHTAPARERDREREEERDRQVDQLIERDRETQRQVGREIKRHISMESQIERKIERLFITILCTHEYLVGFLLERQHMVGRLTDWVSEPFKREVRWPQKLFFPHTNAQYIHTQTPFTHTSITMQIHLHSYNLTHTHTLSTILIHAQTYSHRHTPIDIQPQTYTH